MSNNQDEDSDLVPQQAVIFGYVKIVNKNGQVERTMPIYKAKISKFGRSPETCQLFKDNIVISSVHCKFWGIQFDENTLPICYVQDVSLNGTFVVAKTVKNQLSVHSQHKLTKYECYPLEDGDRIKFPTIVDFSLRFSSTLQYANGERNDQQVFQDLKINEHIHNEWVIQPRFVGSGTYGHVMITRTTNSGKIGAVKIIKNMKSTDRSLTQERGSNKHTMREAKILLGLSHPNIIKLYSTVISDGISPSYKDYYIFQQLVFGGDLFSYLAKTDSLVPVGEEECLVIVYQILLALKYLHSNNVVHRDLKLDNVLLRTPEPCIKIILDDFGIAKRLSASTRLHTVIGTPEYCAPEVGFHKNRVLCESLTRTMTKQHEREGYDFKCDLWSLGVITYICLTGVSPFYSSLQVGTGTTIFDKLNTEGLNMGIAQWDNISPIAKDFVQNLLTVDTKTRLSADGALEHPWISNHSLLLKKIYRKKILREEPRFNSNHDVIQSTESNKKQKRQPVLVKSISSSI